MHIVIAQMSHETNTFSPVITDLLRFSGAGDLPLSGDAALTTFRGTASCMGGYLEVAEAAGAAISIPITAAAKPSGPVEDDAFEYIAGKIVAAAQGCEGMMLDLHGAMVTKSHEDGEGELLRRIRAVAPDVPICVALDMHANIYDDIANLADIVTGYQTYPHIDMQQTAVRAGKLLLQIIAGDIKPTTIWGNAPMLPHVMRQGTDDFPNRELQQQVAKLEAGSALAVSLFTGFPHADIRNAGLSVVVVTDNDPNAANVICDELLDQAWDQRQDFVYQLKPLAASVARAKALGTEVAEDDGPIILLDHYDNTSSGGTMDTTEVLAEVLAQGLEDVAVFGFCDPAAVSEMVAAGVGNEITLRLGGKLAMPALAEQSAPLTLSGRVKLISDGRFTATIAMGRGLPIYMGTTAVLTVGSVDIVVISRHIEPNDPACFRSLGIEPTTRRYLMLKSRVHYRAGFRDMAHEVIECAGRGVCTSDFSQVNFVNVRRPIFPLDNINRRARIAD